jgi:hypothetical protein
MDVEHICWMREYVVTDAKGLDSIRMEFSYDNGRGRTPHFFRVPPQDLAQARALYLEWGGVRDVGMQRGNTVRGPSLPFAPSIKVWRQIGK